MASVNRDMVEGYLDLSRRIDNELQNKNHTVDSLKIFLHQLKVQCKENYQEGADDLGWNEDVDELFE